MITCQKIPLSLFIGEFEASDRGGGGAGGGGKEEEGVTRSYLSTKTQRDFYEDYFTGNKSWNSLSWLCSFEINWKSFCLIFVWEEGNTQWTWGITDEKRHFLSLFCIGFMNSNHEEMKHSQIQKTVTIRYQIIQRVHIECFAYKPLSFHLLSMQH